MAAGRSQNVKDFTFKFYVMGKALIGELYFKVTGLVIRANRADQDQASRFKRWTLILLSAKTVITKMETYLVKCI